ncbi:hypothetical protein M413DRAFT_22712 [Hebeloma cylindrosporum]|uniref:Uncharacterized protein n=1 Tax=Hebeloma cylindrosporum TaxID=76867 RepID=A0A0C3CWH3_HEBCY|nr:hypothetical protein M413DRAFT_22712 [Hebeloma cylindrosporum h7]
MYSSALLVLLTLPFLALAQNNSAASTTITSTTIISSVGLGPGRVETTLISTQVFTTVLPLATGNTTSTNSTNATTSSTSSPSSSPLPTAPTSVNGGGQGGAPVPGAKSTGGGIVYGPDDNYIAAASTIAKNALGASLIASLVGGALAVF